VVLFETSERQEGWEPAMFLKAYKTVCEPGVLGGSRKRVGTVQEKVCVLVCHFSFFVEGWEGGNKLCSVCCPV
jgi:hypothetical protein